MTFALVILSLGVLWTGTASGGAIPDNPDSLFGSLLAILFPGATAAHAPEAAAFAKASGPHWGALAVGLLIAFWAFGPKRRR